MTRRLLVLAAALAAVSIGSGCESYAPPAGAGMAWVQDEAPAVNDSGSPAPDAAPTGLPPELAGLLPEGETVGSARAASIGPVDHFGRFREDAEEHSPAEAEPARQHSFADVGADVDVDVDRTGRRIVFASTRHNLAGDLYLKRTDGVTVTQLTSDEATDVQPTFSPSGRQVAFASNRAGNWDIWVIDTDGRNRIRITDARSADIAPAWSPDGARLAWCSFGVRTRRWEIWVADLANPAVRTFVGFGLFPVFSPDRQVDRIAFQRARQRGRNNFSIWTVDLVNGEPRYPTEVVPAAEGWSATCPAFSPDGKRLCFTEIRLDAGPGPGPADYASAIAVINSDGTNRRRLTGAHGLNVNPAWAPDGKIYFTSNRQGRDSIFSVTVNDATPVERAVTHATRANQPAAANVPTKP